MNYESNDCLVKNQKSATVAVLPLTQQLTMLTEGINVCADRLNTLSVFITDSPLESDRIDDKTVSANLSYAIRMLHMFCDKLEYINDFCR